MGRRVCHWLLIASLVGCGVTPQVSDPGLPAWAEGWGEAPDEVPASGSGLDSRPIAPAWSPETTARGVPQDLTVPVPAAGSGTPARSGARAPGARIAAAPTPEVSGSRLESLYTGRFGRDPSRQLEQFGYGVFRSDGGDPGARVGPVPDDYVLGPGDELLITIAGAFHDVQRQTIDRDGQVTIPEVGAIPLAGQRFVVAAETLRRAYGKTRRGFELTVALGRLRTIRVQVLGHVLQPGPVEVAALAGVVEALAAAGGPTKDGSLRRVTVRRRGQAPREVDLYDYLLGRAELEAPLQAGDVLRVPSVGPTVGVAGFVRRPAIYELAEAEATVDDALELAGGLTPFAFTPRVQLERTEAGRGRARVDLTLDAAGRAATIGDGELLLIGAVDGDRQPVVRLSGEAVRPGNYAWRPGMRVRDLIELGDGLTVDAFLPQAFVSRQVGAAGAVEHVPDRVVHGSPRRVLVLDLGAALRGDPGHDIELHPLDLVSIRSRARATVRPTVRIEGAVQTPGSYELTAGLRVSDLVALAGNLTPNAYYDQAELIRRVLDASRRQLDVRRYRFDLRAALAADSKRDPVLENGDRLVIRSLRQSQVEVVIEGEVRFPGRYVFPAGRRISDLLAAAGLLPSSDLRAAVFTRQSVRELQQERMDQLMTRSQHLHEQALEQMTNGGHDREAIAAKLSLKHSQRQLHELKRQGATGRVVVPFTRADFPGSAHDLVLEDGDRLWVKRRQETVSVVGLVFNPSTFVAEPELTVEAVIDRAGGLLEDGDEDRLYVIRADGNVQALGVGSQSLDLEARLLPGDVVLVPRRPIERTVSNQLADGLALTRQMAEIALILGKVADPKSSVDLTSAGQNNNYWGEEGAGLQEALLSNQ